MASKTPEELPVSTVNRFLLCLKLNGPQSAASMSRHLGITSEAARQQLLRLEGQRLVCSVAEPNGVGRPSAIWRLTDDAHAQFPDRHAQLTVDLIATIRCELGEEAVERIVSMREESSRRSYHAALDAAASLPERVAALAARRSAEGYMAEWWVEPDGSAVLVENHCPIRAAATACQGFCDAELRVFKDVLGPDVLVVRTDHIIAGDRRCAYRIVPKLN